ncbi:XRE family transcriptional regulator [Herbaspirillum rubrisubalbicans]|uniref:helix-turn-helix domain-containing protein n=1 Tax=Herbaspirillum rubrisubalbicans TaxID=80842 RepID=UPI000DC46053|nr:helix-turn-helix transcriptional regulator [Herbaspirillum rubrisubalbicans]RAN48224.1 XRE family transcriptional regulator [Herbaspirillum rubrisubalbicans]
MNDTIAPASAAASDFGKQAIGERLKGVRMMSGLNQRDFAARLGTSGAYISCVELGHSMPGGRFLRTLHREFDVNINWLLTGLQAELPPHHGFHVKVLIGDYVRASERGKSLVMAVASFLVAQGG